jgi:putative transposase
MYLTPFTSLSWAYQLHYNLCFRTHRRRPIPHSSITVIDDLISEICQQHNYHLLECKPHAEYVRSLISLQPFHSISKVAQIIKTNSSRELQLTKPVWARGYWARSAGRMRIEAVRQYLERQAAHHGYASRVLPPIFRFRATQRIELRSPHAWFDLSHHVVFGTRKRKGVFTSSLGAALLEYWLKVAEAREFAVDQCSVVPDHVHLIISVLPRMSIEECALLLMNNGQYFIGKKYPQVYVENGMDQLWEASAYAGTCGDFTTALIKSWLRSD